MESILEGIDNLSIDNSKNAKSTNGEKEEKILKEESIKNEEKRKIKKIKKKKKNKSKENVTQTVAIKPMHEVYVDYLVQWLQENKIGKNESKRLSIARELFWKCCDSRMTEEDLLFIRKKLTESEFVFQPGNLWIQLDTFFGSSKITNFMKHIAELTPTGLNTSPNACCGKFELLYRLLRKNSFQPNKGDISDNGVIIELKGQQVRISSHDLIGCKYKSITDKIFNGKIKGNIVKSGKLKGKTVFEVEKRSHFLHYQNQFKLRTPEECQKMMSHLLSELHINGNIQEMVKKIMNNSNDYQQEIYQRILLNDWFEKYKARMSFDKLMIFGDGKNVKIIENTEQLSNCRITSDYFRIAQTTSLGWYIQ
jgi:hypothetical protein